MVGIDVKGFIDWVDKAGIVGVVILVLVALQQRWLLLPRELDVANAAWEERMRELARDRDEWKERALTSMRLGDRAVAAATAPAVGTPGAT